jgi:hypothetical protein
MLIYVTSSCFCIISYTILCLKSTMSFCVKSNSLSLDILSANVQANTPQSSPFFWCGISCKTVSSRLITKNHGCSLRCLPLGYKHSTSTRHKVSFSCPYALLPDTEGAPNNVAWWIWIHIKPDDVYSIPSPIAYCFLQVSRTWPTASSGSQRRLASNVGYCLLVSIPYPLKRYRLFSSSVSVLHIPIPVRLCKRRYWSNE